MCLYDVVIFFNVFQHIQYQAHDFKPCVKNTCFSCADISLAGVYAVQPECSRGFIGFVLRVCWCGEAIVSAHCTKTEGLGVRMSNRGDALPSA